MPPKVRVFISSTMEDLANERQAIVEQVKGLDLEPVNAEGLFPNGEASWNLLSDEISTSHVFILVLGDRYGWIPDKGYGADQNKSVTHLEADYARSISIPILPFFKKLKYGSDRTSKDAILRDKFRGEISAWENGMFKTDFDLAMDLGRKVRETLLGIFQNTYLKQTVRKVEEKRSASLETAHRSYAVSVGRQQFSSSSVLLAGAGFSIAAGYPTASTLTEVLGQRLGLISNGIEILHRHSFSEVAAYAEKEIGRGFIIDTIKELLNTAVPVHPTQAHLAAVQAFRFIITTNYDNLFERACNEIGIKYSVKTPASFQSSNDDDVVIYKIDGSIDDPANLNLTYEDAIRAQGSVEFWKPIKGVLSNSSLVVVGSSMRDVNTKWIADSRNKDIPGVYVSPQLDELDRILLKRYNLEGIKSDADTYMASIFNVG